MRYMPSQYSMNEGFFVQHMELASKYMKEIMWSGWALGSSSGMSLTCHLKSALAFVCLSSFLSVTASLLLVVVMLSISASGQQVLYEAAMKAVCGRVSPFRNGLLYTFFAFCSCL